MHNFWWIGWLCQEGTEHRVVSLDPQPSRSKIDWVYLLQNLCMGVCLVGCCRPKYISKPYKWHSVPLPFRIFFLGNANCFILKTAKIVKSICLLWSIMKRNNLLRLSECRAKSKHLAGFYSPAGLIYTVYCTRAPALSISSSNTSSSPLRATGSVLNARLPIASAHYTDCR